MLLPCAECKGKCCTYPTFTPQEFLVVRLAVGIPFNATVTPFQHVENYDKNVDRGASGYMIALADGTCPYLKEGKCSIYSMRPKVCKDYGVVPDLPCQYLYPKEAEAKQKERMKRSML